MKLVDQRLAAIGIGGQLAEQRVGIEDARVLHRLPDRGHGTDVCPERGQDTVNFSTTAGVSPMTRTRTPWRATLAGASSSRPAWRQGERGRGQANGLPPQLQAPIHERLGPGAHSPQVGQQGPRDGRRFRDGLRRVAGEAVVAGADGGRHRRSDRVFDVSTRAGLDAIGWGLVEDGEKPVQRAVQGDERGPSGIVDISFSRRAAPRSGTMNTRPQPSAAPAPKAAPGRRAARSRFGMQ